MPAGLADGPLAPQGRQRSATPAAGQPTVITDPLVIMFKEPGGQVITHIHRQPGDTHELYGLPVCDLVRHVANAFQVSEDAVWEWVDKGTPPPDDRHHPAVVSPR
jgi:hypothetical protein